MNTPAILLDGVSRTFSTPKQTVTAVDNVSFTIKPGEIVALLGPNGAGKTTTLDMILGQYAPTSGSIALYGERPRDVVKKGRISAVLQTGGLLPSCTVKETVSIINALFPTTIGVEKAMERAGITAIADRRVSKCSGGQQQRIKFALALLPDPDLIILDEPTAGMDIGARHEFWASMRQEAALGKSIVFATHYLEEAEMFAERVILMARGRVVADGPTHELRALTGARHVTCTWNDDDGAPSTVPGASSTTRQGDRVTFAAQDSDAVARHLLTRTGAKDLEIRAASLEDAFLSLTGAPAADDASLESEPRA
jgi:ABC-2 type transport system ATP-binding protein